MNPMENLLMEVTSQLDSWNTTYCITGYTALYLQGLDISVPSCVEIHIQWDAMEQVYVRMREQRELSDMERDQDAASFSFTQDGVLVRVKCLFNTVVATDPYRIQVAVSSEQLWVKSMYAYVSLNTVAEPDLADHVQRYLVKLQQENRAVNERAWNQDTYQAWVARHGTPEEAAEKIRRNPRGRLFPLYQYFGNIRDQKVANLLGSHGGKAVALALLGARVTVVDISKENQAYALAVAEAAGTQIRYVVSDVLELPEKERTGDYDFVVMELGILHYFVDLRPLGEIVYNLLRTGGRLLLHDFHPISTKLLTSNGKKHKVTGNYFSPALETRDVAFAKHLTDMPSAQVRLRRWTLGEIVTSFASAGLVIMILSEEPNHKMDDIGIPKTFTLVAEKQ